MHEKEKLASIKEITPVYIVEIHRCGLLERLVKKHPYHVNIRGKESYDLYADRIALDGVMEVTLSGQNNHLIRLFSLHDLVFDKNFVARITEYPDDDYSVVWIHREKLEED